MISSAMQMTYPHESIPANKACVSAAALMKPHFPPVNGTGRKQNCPSPSLLATSFISLLSSSRSTLLLPLGSPPAGPMQGALPRGAGLMQRWRRAQHPHPWGPTQLSKAVTSPRAQTALSRGQSLIHRLLRRPIQPGLIHAFA